jgi:hypothetical protein
VSRRSVFWRLVLLCCGIRAVLEIIGLVSLQRDGQPVWSNALDLWRRWDASHYLRLAQVGYRSGHPPPDDPLFIVFFPLFPLAVRTVSVVARDLVLSGLLVSLAASVGAGWFLYRIVELDADGSEAWRAVVLLFSFPTAYYLAAPYTEALFLFAVTASMYSARTGRWARSGMAGALATGTRITGVALLPALLVEAFSGRAEKAERASRLVWVMFAGSGLLLYLAINQIVDGDPLWFLKVQRSNWFQQPVPPWTSVIDGVSALLNDRPTNPVRTQIFAGRTAAVLIALPLLVVGIKRLRAADSVYAWTGFLLILSTSWLISLPRYLLVLYPLFMVGGKITSSKRVFVPLITVAALLQAVLFWRYAAGEWTF